MDNPLNVMMTNKTYPAAEAMAIDLVNEVLDDDEFDEGVLRCYVKTLETF